MNDEGRRELGISARKTGAALRVFFALPLPADRQAAVAGWIERLRARPQGDAVRWVRPEGLHLTLRFLGNVPTEDVPQLVEAVREKTAATEPFTLKLGAPEAFPAKRPQVVLLSVSPEDRVSALAARIDVAVEPFGHPPERRHFRPHVTLGRLRSRRYPELGEDGSERSVGGAAQDAAEWHASEVVLFKSELARDGARYAPIATIPLEPATSAASNDHP